ncbi:hypothetical protein EN828_25310 [Mesorhizobium sp. M2D.F.Ca.ET.185.01.1.1]|uniref:hypothetical protein n=1 Tax=unclassified Mesorhizobium TaxID=325217 RepID=UPI000FCB766B|nr:MULTISPECIES: hypothetical protein [unclassified Mesorhizobium]TGP74368.1 hypothetical protein EN870_27125 [bacterium M00.F.Ca.ET.227.01.1.1]TGP85054.1 hypothetical protein EN864_27230 [bacterium M00.F.Ca.ET.221.01.1.1]TGP89137.1 hypothetical protein EN865_25655 [bacterium M00.F.Ca.ET.222.01.1.1]TGU12804.1 hypothetical protein EN806_15605 [bacterium M00.F.Ca.ET.163.01.1.1]TGU21292.1 hypothetical protein EN799_53990 [bacterium M00.F.Ca.ET.156.01.1.1]TGU43689.1 hypothetical protein EN789_262
MLKLLPPMNDTDAQQIAASFWRELAIYGSHERAGPLLERLNGMPINLFWLVFQSNWHTCDDLWPHTKGYTQILNYAKRWKARPYDYLSTSVRAWFDELPDPIPVYRGSCFLKKNGLSWTTDKNIAEGFARGHRGISVPLAVVAEGLIAKSKIFTAIGRKECEIVLNPKNLQYADFKLYDVKGSWGIDHDDAD